MSRITTHRRIAAVIAVALMFAAAAPMASARWFNFNSHGTMVLITPRAWQSGQAYLGAAVSIVDRIVAPIV